MLSPTKIMRLATFGAVFLTAACSAPASWAQRGADRSGKPTSIAWYGVWTAGLAEAKKSGRPILLIAAAPHCHGVSGIW